jgi:hypothetical protein
MLLVLELAQVLWLLNCDWAVGTIKYSWKNASIEVGTTASVANLPAGTYTNDDCSSKSNSVTVGNLLLL